MSERGSPPALTAIILLVLVMGLGLGVYFFWEAESSPDNVLVGEEVPLGRLPDDWAVTDLDGNEVLARSWHGKVVFLNNWATWCGPCVGEMPSIQALYQSLQGSDVVFVILTNEKVDRVKSFVKQKNWDLPIYLAVEGLPPVLRTQGIPATFIINRQGEVIFKHVGAVDWNTNAVRSFLKKVS